jgi:transposase
MAQRGLENSLREREAVALRGKIIGLHMAGKINSEIAYMLGIHKTTVTKWLRRHEEEGNVSSKPRSGRPRKTSPEIDRLIIAEGRNNPLGAATDTLQTIQPGVSIDTVRRRLKEGGLHHYRPAPKEELSPANIRQRLAFAAEHE